MAAIPGRLEKMRVHLPPVNAAQLKYFAALIMLIDHVTYTFLERAYTDGGQPLMNVLPYGSFLDRLGRAAGRQAFPIFCFFLVEGFFYTRSRIRYFMQILVFALVSQFPFQKCFFPRSQTMHANVLFTLGIGLAAVWILETIKKICTGGRAGAAGLYERYGRSRQDGSGAAHLWDLLLQGLAAAAAAGTVYGAVFLARFLHSDYSYGGVILIVLLYMLRGYRMTALFISWVWLSWYNRLELYAAPAFFLLACYNGQRGRQTKYFFYLFYPVHLALLLIIRGCFFGM